MIDSNRTGIMKLNQNTIKNIKQSNNKDAVLYSNVINLYKIYEDYICNILLLAHTIFLSKSSFNKERNKEETFRCLNKLVKEMDEKLEFNKCIDIMCDYLKANLEKQNKGDYSNEIEIIFLRYLNLVSSIAKLFYKLGEFSSYEIFIVKTVEKIEKIYSNSSNPYILAYAYLIMGNLYVELDSLGKAIQLYTQSINLLEDPKDRPEITGIFIDANYNLGLLYFVTDQYTLAKNKIDLAIKYKREVKQEEISEQMANFYETLGEIELEYKNHQLSYMNLQKALDIRSKLPNSHDAKSVMKINIMLDFLFQNLEKDMEKKNKTTTTQVDKTFMRAEERDLDDVLTYMKVTHDDKGELRRKAETLKKGRQEFDIDEMEKFFLLMSKLTPYQLKVLNDTQGDVVKNPSLIMLPIVFSSEFKDIISVNQRLEVCNLKLMSLKRDKILKDPYQKIEVENLNYDALYSRNFQNNLTNIKNYFVVNKILKNWENTTKIGNNLNTTQMNHSNNLSNISSNQIYRGSRVSVRENNMASKSSFMNANNNAHGGNSLEHKHSNFHPQEKHSKEEKIEYSEFKKCIYNYAEINCNEEMNHELRSDEEMLYQIYKELEKEDLDLIMQHPQIIFQYIEIAKENDKTKIELDSSPYVKREEPKLSQYLEQENKIKEEPEEESVMSHISRKSRADPSSIIDTSNINDEKNNDKVHRLMKEKEEKEKLHRIEEENPEKEEIKLKEEPQPENNPVKTEDKHNEDKKSELSADEKKLEKNSSQGSFKPNIPNKVKDLLMKQSSEKNIKKDGSNPSLNKHV